MNKEILYIIERLRDAYEGDPWFGRNVQSLLSEVDEKTAFVKPEGQHSIVELVWHMITWKEFTVSRIRNDNKIPMRYFETSDWRQLDHSDSTLWKKGLQRLDEVHRELVNLVQQQTDELLDQTVSERTYDFRKLLNGIIEHDIYHAGQIAYIRKVVDSE